MNSNYTSLVEQLNNLKNLGCLTAIKAEFEAEGTTLEELLFLSKLCASVEIPLTLKIGGPAAQRDVYESILAGAKNILSPMIESVYALDAFNYSISYSTQALGLSLVDINAFINIESKQAVVMLDSICSELKSSSSNISTVVIGRSDLARSYHIDNVESPFIHDICSSILDKLSSSDIMVAIGGALTVNSYSFLQSLKVPPSFYETRKCTFAYSQNTSPSMFNSCVKSALMFELAWLRYKKSYYSHVSQSDNLRISSILNRI